jgi:hypothetical protein
MTFRHFNKNSAQRSSIRLRIGLIASLLLIVNISFSQNDTKNSINFTLLRKSSFKPIHPTYTLGLNYHRYLKPKFLIKSGIEGSFRNFENFIYTDGIDQDYYTSTSNGIRILFGYSYQFNAEKRRVKFYTGTNIFYDFNKQQGDFYYNESQTDNNLYATAHSKNKIFGIEQNFEIRFYLTNKFYILTEIATWVGKQTNERYSTYPNQTFTSTPYKNQGIYFKPLNFRLKIGFDF